MCHISKDNDSSAKTIHKKKDNIDSDVLGSYTGIPSDGDVPEQDADDL